ncbi:GlmU family protein [Gaetbulibacter aestuarii]|uniref:GlmU family protein n=1 Tax=Gaetbulibacter aestuarii TaxID=1502358 RepID=A0ABW7N203_9FLAO
MNYILFDGPFRDNLLPFTYTRPVADIRVGILTLREKWEYFLKTKTSSLTEDYLSGKFPLVSAKINVMIHAAYGPNDALVKKIKELKSGQAIVSGDQVVAYVTDTPEKRFEADDFDVIQCQEPLLKIENTWDIFVKNGVAMKADFDVLTKGRKSEPIPKSNNIIGAENIFIEPGAKLEFTTINASSGPVYIGKDAEIMEGSIIRGPFALCEHATLKLGAKIYGPTTVGPHSKVGGEVNNCVIFGYSNKGHDGFLGNSVLGEWCNLGADTNNSNLKNNYAPVRLWDYKTQSFAKTGLQFCGLMMGDHSKCGINTMFNTGTVVGVSSNIYGSGFPRNFVPSFSWGGSSGFTTYLTKKAFEVCEVMMARRNVAFTNHDKAILDHIFEATKDYRRG